MMGDAWSVSVLRKIFVHKPVTCLLLPLLCSFLAFHYKSLLAFAYRDARPATEGVKIASVNGEKEGEQTDIPISDVVESDGSVSSVQDRARTGEALNLLPASNVTFTQMTQAANSRFSHAGEYKDKIANMVWKNFEKEGANLWWAVNKHARVLKECLTNLGINCPPMPNSQDESAENYVVMRLDEHGDGTANFRDANAMRALHAKSEEEQAVIFQMTKLYEATVKARAAFPKHDSDSFSWRRLLADKKLSALGPHHDFPIFSKTADRIVDKMLDVIMEHQIFEQMNSHEEWEKSTPKEEDASGHTRWMPSFSSMVPDSLKAKHFYPDLQAELGSAEDVRGHVDAFREAVHALEKFVLHYVASFHNAKRHTLIYEIFKHAHDAVEEMLGPQGWLKQHDEHAAAAAAHTTVSLQSVMADIQQPHTKENHSELEMILHSVHKDKREPNKICLRAELQHLEQSNFDYLKTQKWASLVLNEDARKSHREQISSRGKLLNNAGKHLALVKELIDLAKKHGHEKDGAQRTSHGSN
ncbi:unnamed protein product [Amoebophrya sp. A120]|nr:unnamed protein product [Amoebophrya sp. A120]|eukprot:GSA120T00017604001.1